MPNDSTFGDRWLMVVGVIWRSALIALLFTFFVCAVPSFAWSQLIIWPCGHRTNIQMPAALHLFKFACSVVAPATPLNLLRSEEALTSNCRLSVRSDWIVN